MKIDGFLDEYVNGYLLHDLESMRRHQLPRGETLGGLGYTMLMVTLSGMELLGALVYPHTNKPASYDHKKDGAYFKEYWDHYLSELHQEYRVPGLQVAARCLLRNGLMHTFLAKHIDVWKGARERHLTRDPRRGTLSVDAEALYLHFRSSYETLIWAPIIGGGAPERTTRDNMQMVLEDMLRRYSREANKKLADFITRMHEAPVFPTAIASVTTASAAPTYVNTGGTIAPTETRYSGRESAVLPPALE